MSAESLTMALQLGTRFTFLYLGSSKKCVSAQSKQRMIMSTFHVLALSILKHRSPCWQDSMQQAGALWAGAAASYLGGHKRE